MVSEEKKRRIKLSAVFGAITGTALAVVLYLVTTPNPMYFILIPIAAGMAVGQAYMMPEPE